ncbi:hypothetical protein, partial [Bacillus mycoides]
NGGQNAGQGFTANPIATNIAAGGQCLPVISVVTPMTPLISQLVCNGGQNAGQGFTTNNQTGSINLPTALNQYKQYLKQVIEQIEKVETNCDNNQVN